MKDEKYRIEKNSVQETLIVPLYGRKMCAEKFPELYTDKSAKILCDKLDYDFSNLEKKKDSFLYEFGALEAAMRQLDIMWEINHYLKKHPQATVINLGCGLDQTCKACDNGKCTMVNIDLSDIIEIRKQLIPTNEREINIACNLKDFSWMDKIDSSNGAIFFAAGVFHYFKTDEVKTMVFEMQRRFPNCSLVFDSVGKKGLKLMMSKTLKNMDIDVEGLFYIDDPNKDLNWTNKIIVSSKGYMLGYHNMKGKNINFLHRLLAKIVDKYLKLSINRMDFIV